MNALLDMILRRRARLASAAVLFAVACTEPPTTGTLTLNVTGLPSGANAAIRVIGPNQFDQRVRQTITLESLLPGEYTVTSDTVRIADVRYGVAVVNETVTIVRGGNRTIDAAYGLASGVVSVSIEGLPNGSAAGVVLRGPLNPTGSPAVEELVLESRTIHALRPGSYEILADTSLSIEGDKFAAAKRLDTIAVAASLAPVLKSIQYTLISGSLGVTINGLPSTIVMEPVLITGPGGFERRVAQSTSMRGLLPGTYTIVAENTSSVSCQTVFTATDTPFGKQETTVIGVGETTSVTFNFVERPAKPDWLNLRIGKVYLTQATQNARGTVPIITGKPALLRVFGVANQCNDAIPQVRLTLSTGTQITIDAVEDSVRLISDDAVLGASWNYVIPAVVMQRGLSVVAEIDPSNGIAEANEGDNRFPASGSYTPDIRTAPVVGLRFVPVHQSINNLTGTVNPGNVDQFLEFPRKLHPVGTFDVDFHAPFTTAQPALTANGTSTWSAILGEISALQQAEGSRRYYYGVVRVNYNSGIAGIAYVPGRTGLGWDILPSGSRIMAHEMGHNFGRLHTPCGGPAGVDAAYPSIGAYADGGIGVNGWDPVEGLKAADRYTDVMGYCNPQWISDYTYVGMLNGIVSQSPSLPAVSNNEQPSLLIWGRIVNGEPVLEPAFEISARPVAPSTGPHRVVATDSTGAELFAVSFSGERIADIPEDVETFAFTVPVSALRGRTLGSLRLSARGRTVSAMPAGDVASDPTATVTRVNSREARIRWDASRFPVVMVRDANGQVLSFARDGDVTVTTSQSTLDLNFSNRVRSTRRLKEFK